MFNTEFYPTPEELVDKMLEKVDVTRHKNILEPSAGKGDIVDGIKRKFQSDYNSRYMGYNIEAIEISPELSSILKDKDVNVIYDDFLGFQTYKNYSLIVMNPPFSNGDQHLLKAMDIMKRGGEIVCLLNAETINNPYSNSRKDLVRKLNDCNAEIELIEGAFANGERKTSVSIVLIHIVIPKEERKSMFFKDLQKSEQFKDYKYSNTEIVHADPLEQLIQNYNVEMRLGQNLINEYLAMKPYIQNSLAKEIYSVPLIELKVLNMDNDSLLNTYCQGIRNKYWSAAVGLKEFRRLMTTDLEYAYMEQLNSLSMYEFNRVNIDKVKWELMKFLGETIEDTIYDLFNDFTHKYSYNEFSSNIHMYNGWKTNKVSKINDKKVIMPYFSAFCSWSKKFRPDYQVATKIRNIEKALNYLDQGRTDNFDDINEILETARNEGQTRNIEFKYFFITFYKKGTAHIQWKDKEIIKKLNIFGGKRENGLPPYYGQVDYDDLSDEDKEVVESFEGKKEYQKTYRNQSLYILDKNKLLQLAG